MSARVEAFIDAWQAEYEAKPRPDEIGMPTAAESVFGQESLAGCHAMAWEAIAEMARAGHQPDAARFRRVFQRLYGKRRA